MAKIQNDRPSPYLTAEQRERLRARVGGSIPEVFVDDRPPPGTVEFRIEDNEVVASIVNLAETESATEQEQPVTRALPADWDAMPEAPINRPIFLTADPTSDHQGLLCYWRTTREKNKPPTRGWSPKSFWASVLTKREVEFEPACWREAMVQGAAALQAVV